MIRKHKYLPITMIFAEPDGRIGVLIDCNTYYSMRSILPQPKKRKLTPQYHTYIIRLADDDMAALKRKTRYVFFHEEDFDGVEEEWKQNGQINRRWKYDGL